MKKIFVLLALAGMFGGNCLGAEVEPRFVEGFEGAEWWKDWKLTGAPARCEAVEKDEDEETDIRMRHEPKLKIEKIWFNVYHGGKDPSPVEGAMFIDGVVIGETRGR